MQVIDTLCTECASLIENHEKIQVLSAVHYNLGKTLQDVENIVALPNEAGSAEAMLREDVQLMQVSQFLISRNLSWQTKYCPEMQSLSSSSPAVCAGLRDAVHSGGHQQYGTASNAEGLEAEERRHPQPGLLLQQGQLLFVPTRKIRSARRMAKYPVTDRASNVRSIFAGLSHLHV